MIAPKTGVGDRPHRVTLYTPGSAVPDGDSGYTQEPAALDPPAMYARLVPATGTDLERVASGTVLSTATHIVTMPYHPQVTTQTQLRFGARIFNVVGVSDPEERHVETVALCVEVVR